MMSLDFGFGPVEAEFWRWVFVMTRIGAAMLAAPFFGATNVPMEIRVVVTGAVAVLVCAWTNVSAPAMIFSIQGLMAVGGEVVIGLALGFVLQFAFAAPTIAAEIIGGGMGMGLAAAADPQSGAQSPALGQYFGVVLTLIFLSMGGHLQWLGLVVKSYSVFPPGHAWLGPARFMEIIGFANTMFLTAVAMALPVTLVLLLVQLLSGVLGRSAPALNLFSLGLPAGIVAGFAALIISMPLVVDRLTDISGDAVAAAAQLLGHG